MAKSIFDRKPDMDHVRVLHVKRLPNSVNGNPRYDVTFWDPDGQWTYRTSSDASCNYEVTNYLGSGQFVDVWLTKADRIAVIRPSVPQTDTWGHWRDAQ